MASLSVVISPCTQAIFSDAVETILFYGQVSFYSFFPDSPRRVYRRRPFVFRTIIVISEDVPILDVSWQYYILLADLYARIGIRSRGLC